MDPFGRKVFQNPLVKLFTNALAGRAMNRKFPSTGKSFVRVPVP
jgi:hypothetical protein